MNETLVEAARRQGLTDPSWNLALLFPDQGQWSTEDYLLLPTNRLVELSDGRIEVLPMPTRSHQRTVMFLLRELERFLSAGLGEVIVAPYPLQLRDGKFREPDLLVVLARNAGKLHERYARGADLVVEVVNPNDPQRDTRTKRDEYAAARIAEYWIVDPRDTSIEVLVLGEEAYVLHGRFGPGERARSVLLPGFEIEVLRAFDRESTAS